MKRVTVPAVLLGGLCIFLIPPAHARTDTHLLLRLISYGLTCRRFHPAQRLLSLRDR
jgi:hypothetical protein